MGADVFCSRSKKAPSKFAIQSLQHMAEQRAKDTLHKYEDNKHVSLRLLGFSCGYSMFRGEHFGYVPEVQWSDTGLMKFKKRAIIIKLDKSNYHIRIPLSTVIELIWSRDGTLTLTLSTVPYFFSHEGPDPLTIAFQMLQLGSSKYHPAAPSRSRMCSLSPTHADVAGQCLVYQFRVPSVDLMKDILDIKDLEIAIIRHDVLPLNTLPMGAFQVQLKALMDELATCTRNNSLPFGILYQLQALAYNAYLLPRTVQSLAQELIKAYKEDAAAHRRPISVLAMKKLFDMIDWPSPHGNPTDFEVGALMMALKQNQKDVLQDLAASGDMLGPSDNLTPIHKVMVTPTRFSSPFVDESGQFQTHFSIIKALGDFSKIQSPARCAARIGQAFTDTPYAISLSEYDIEVSEMADVTSKDGKRVFSDGIGTLSWNVAESIWHNIPEKKGFPTCFQVRLGGAKGMLAVDGRLSGSQVKVRPSMIKFQGDMKDLEICDMAAKPMVLVLNRQMIKILEDMGTPDDWFLTLQEAALTKLRSVTASAHNSEVFLWSTLERCDKIGNLSWERWLDEARHIRLRYEEAVFSARNNYSEHPIDPLSELEVFIGSVMNKGGVQTRWQRDQSNKLADEFDRISTWIVGQMRAGSSSESPITSVSDQLKPLEFCLACIHVGGESNKDPARRRREVYGEIKSFRVVAACALLFELDLIEKGRKGKF
ncbi:hypothetical protein AnigIFM50267_011409 [Aspergillus niger]|nr:hypothetical protein AnigIFM50267_011409 [Aspergillus niger]